MMIKLARFNTYLCLAMIALGMTGCRALNLGRDKKPKVGMLIELHLEDRRDRLSETQMVPIGRTNPFYINVDRDPFVDSGDLEDAAVVEEMGGFVIRLKFGTQGSAELDTVSAANPGRHIAVLCISEHSRWIAAPVIGRPIRDGIFTFTPDATREEAEKIVEGIKAVKKELHKDDLL